jgi:hypothetical protein
LDQGLIGKACETCENYPISGQEKQKNYVMRKLFPTLTQSGLLALLLQRQRYKIIQLARRRAHRKHMRTAFWSTLAWPFRAFMTPTVVDDSA